MIAVFRTMKHSITAGFVMASYSIGPIMGFGLGGVALGIYVTLGGKAITNITAINESVVRLTGELESSLVYLP